MDEENIQSPESQFQRPEPKPDDITFFAAANYRNQNRKFGIKRDDRRRHMYFVGKTGMGKSTVLENMIYSDIMMGNGLGVVDPHGDLAEKALSFVPSWRTNDVVYLNPSDIDYPVAFNVLERVSDSHKHLVASGLLQVFKKLWADSWGPRLEYILMNTLLALIDYPGSTLLGVTRMLVDKHYRRKVVACITDPVVRSFWVDEYENYSDKFRSEAIAPIQNKVGQFLSSAIIRNIVGQSKSTIDMREIMDNRKILIMNLSKGRVGEDNSALLGAMMITKLQIAAMSRVDIPEPTRKDFYLYVDEFQNFATESFAGILSEARKYRLALIMAHQYIEQLSDEVKAAVFGNVGTLATFRIGAEDAEFLEREFTPVFTQEDLVNLTKYEIYLKLMIDGVASQPFSATILPPVKTDGGDPEKVIRVSRERYSRPRSVVETKITRWAGMQGGDEDIDDAVSQSASAPTLGTEQMLAHAAASPGGLLTPTPAIAPTGTNFYPPTKNDAPEPPPISEGQPVVIAGAETGSARKLSLMDIADDAGNRRMPRQQGGGFRERGQQQGMGRGDSRPPRRDFGDGGQQRPRFDAPQRRDDRAPYPQQPRVERQNPQPQRDVQPRQSAPVRATSPAPTPSRASEPVTPAKAPEENVQASLLAALKEVEAPRVPAQRPAPAPRPMQSAPHEPSRQQSPQRAAQPSRSQQAPRLLDQRRPQTDRSDVRDRNQSQSQPQQRPPRPAFQQPVRQRAPIINQQAAAAAPMKLSQLVRKPAPQDEDEDETEEVYIPQSAPQQSPASHHSSQGELKPGQTIVIDT